MSNLRLVARLDVKGSHLVKGIQMEGLRKVGDPHEFARKYYVDGIDEIIYEDVVASLYERNSLSEIIERTTEDVFVPVTVGGGLRSVEDVSAALAAGADKVTINTAAIRDPRLIGAVAERFGSQCLVLSIQAKRRADGWEAYYDNGRERSGKDVVAWAREGESMGAGEILLTSVDREGAGKGFDVELTTSVTDAVNIPVVASGGMGRLADIDPAVDAGGADAIAMASVLHYGKISVEDVRMYCQGLGYPVRSVRSRPQ